MGTLVGSLTTQFPSFLKNMKNILPLENKDVFVGNKQLWSHGSTSTALEGPLSQTQQWDFPLIVVSKIIHLLKWQCHQHAQVK